MMMTEYPINTGAIYVAEHNHWENTHEYREVIRLLENSIEEILITKRLMSLPWNDYTPEYMFEKFEEYQWYRNRAFLQTGEPFQEIFIRYHAVKGVSTVDEKPFDVYEYSKDCLLTGHEILIKGRETLFTFALRQVDLFELDDFLSYHLVKTFKNDSQALQKWVNLVLREYHVLFDVNRIRSVTDSLQTVCKQVTNRKHTENITLFTDNNHLNNKNSDVKIDLLNSDPSSIQMAQASKEVMNIYEASVFLGLAKSTLYYYSSKNLIPYMKKGKRLYFSKDELKNWLTEGKKLTLPEKRLGTVNYIVNKKNNLK